jgi:hypothetical protein
MHLHVRRRVACAFARLTHARALLWEQERKHCARATLLHTSSKETAAALACGRLYYMP